MKKLRKEIEYTEFSSDVELREDLRALVHQAIEASKSAYAPYSHFKVGAALLLANGACVIGNNQENSAYPSGLCAERVAMFAAAANYPGVAFHAMAVYASAPFHLENPVSPCGACRQVMVEYENLYQQDMMILLCSESGTILSLEKSSELLPFSFHENKLKLDAKKTII
jgi:cytidine deaminase